MDKKDYLNTLKSLKTGPGKVKIEHREETILMETDQSIIKRS
jgi:hypothetical protein